MSSHKANKSVALAGILVAIGVVAVAFFVNSRHDAANPKAATPPPVAAVAATTVSPGDVSAPADDLVGRAARAPDATPLPVAVPEPPVAPVASAPRATEATARMARTRVVIHDVPESEPARQVPEVASSPILDPAPSMARPDPMPNAVASVDAIDDAATDQRITTGVRTAIAADSQISSLGIGVTSFHGHVALSGHLDSQATIDHARDVARSVANVISVDVTELVIASL